MSRKPVGDDALPALFVPSANKSRSGYQKLERDLSFNEFFESDTQHNKMSAGFPPVEKLKKSKETHTMDRTVSSTSRNTKKASKTTHPIFNLPDILRSKKAMANPDFLRYMEYVKEAGTWNPDSNKPVIHFK